jgi:hypothetical protein
MPGPGQGKRAHKKKWHDNTRTTLAVHTVTATTLSDTMNTTASATATAYAAAIDANNSNNAMCIDTATAASSDNAVLQPPSFIYTHKEVQVLLDKAQLEGRKLGYEDGFEDGLKNGKEYLEDAKLQSYREGRDEGYKQARQDNAEVEEEKYQEGRSECITRGLQAGEYNE